MHRATGEFYLQLLARQGNPKWYGSSNDNLDDPNRHDLIAARAARNVALCVASDCLGRGTVWTRNSQQTQKMAAVRPMPANPLRRGHPLSSAGLRWWFQLWE